MNSRLDRITDWEQVAAESDYKVEEMARKREVSSRQLRRYFQEAFGISPKRWLSELRARRAARQLARGEMVKVAAIDQKFKHRSYFSKFFQKQFGVSPRNYSAE